MSLHGALLLLLLLLVEGVAAQPVLLDAGSLQRERVWPRGDGAGWRRPRRPESLRVRRLWRLWDVGQHPPPDAAVDAAVVAAAAAAAGGSVVVAAAGARGRHGEVR